jgi:6-pyruvoyltetrahydropterin/6-carboxytetrahydropterin synthase
MFVLRIKERFDAAHYLNDYKGDCANIHGHTWHVEVFLKMNVIGRNGITLDFKEAKGIIRKHLPDHKCLNKEFDFNPTAENLARHLFTKIKKEINIKKIILWETENNGVEYTEDQ